MAGIELHTGTFGRPDASAGMSFGYGASFAGSCRTPPARRGPLFPVIAISAALLVCSSLQAAESTKETPFPAPGAAQGSARKDNPATPAQGKLDAQIVLALKQSRGEPPFDKPGAAQPDIPIKDGSRVLVDLNAAVSDDLLRQVEALGGRLAPSPDPAHVVRAMIPLGEIEALANRAEITFIAPARLYHVSGVSADPGPQGGNPDTKP